MPFSFKPSRILALTMAVLASAQCPSAAAGEPLSVSDPLLQAQFAQARCLANLHSTMHWLRAGTAALLSGKAWSAAVPATTGERWATAAPGCAQDRASGLVWAIGSVQDGVALVRPTGDNEVRTIDQVIADARRQRLCGSEDWRLPTRGEMAALIDYTQLGAAVIPGLSTFTRTYWTSTPQHALSEALVVTADWHKPGAKTPTRPLRGGRFTVAPQSGWIATGEVDSRASVLLVHEAACHALGGTFWW